MSIIGGAVGVMQRKGLNVFKSMGDISYPYLKTKFVSCHVNLILH